MVKKLTLEQDKRKVPKHIPNPTGTGGLGERPQDINYGGRPKNQESCTYWINFFKNLSVTDFKNYEKTNTDDKRTVAESLAYARVSKARNDLREFQEVANRTEGTPKQLIDLSGDLTTRIITEIEKPQKLPDDYDKKDNY